MHTCDNCGQWGAHVRAQEAWGEVYYFCDDECRIEYEEQA